MNQVKPMESMEPMENRPSCKLIRSTKLYAGKQGMHYAEAISLQSAGSQAICMHLLTLPPLAQSNAHLHQDHETAIYVISGQAAMWYGKELEQHMEVGAGDFIYIPASVPHLTYNPSAAEACTAVIARTDPNEQESVTLLPELQARFEGRTPP